MADDFEEFKKRYQSGQTKMLSNPPPLPGPAGIGRAVVGMGVQTGIRNMKNLSSKGPKEAAKETAKDASKSASKGSKSQRSNSSSKSDKETKRSAGNFAGRRMDDAKKSRGPYGTLATQGTREVTRFTRGPRDVARASEASSKAVTKYQSPGSNAVTVAGGRGNFGGGKIVGPSNAARSVGAGKGFNPALKGDDQRSNKSDKTDRKPTELRKASGTYTASYDKKPTSNSAAKTDKQTVGAPATNRTFGTQFKSDAAKKFASKGQGQAAGVKKQNSTSNQGAKANKPTKIISQGPKKDKYSDLQRAYRGADAGAAYINRKLGFRGGRDR